MIPLQNTIFPDPDISTDQDLYCRLNDRAKFDAKRPGLAFQPGGEAVFDTYFNLFSLGKWHNECHLDGLSLGLAGTGRFELAVVLLTSEKRRIVLVQKRVTLQLGTETQVDLSHYAEVSTWGVIYFELKALSAANLSEARFETARRSASLPRLTISITTFKREKDVAQTAQRLQCFLGGFLFRDQIEVLVVDNGQSVNIPPADRLRVLPNANLGGAGGFARGLLEAQDNGSTHCLFMDDDASFHMENIHRTYMFLSLARDSHTALAGAMISNARKTILWENGAIFHKSCRPLYNGMDLGCASAVIDMELKTAQADPSGALQPENFYGGWWYFAFPLAHVRHHPFPFFVRGDDISFSLANDFRISTLNGLVSFQDDFAEKESPLTLYLDLRGHIIHHLVFDPLEIGALGCASIGLRFIMRSLVRFHYETAEAQLLAWQDVLEGPEFFDRNADMATRRQTVGALMKDEGWHPVADFDLSQRHRFTGRGRMWQKFALFTLNGHFLPFFAAWGDRIVVQVGDRGTLYPIWGAAQITYLNSSRNKGYMVRQSKPRFFAFCLRLLGAGVRFLWAYRKLRQAYKDAYPEMTSRDYWEKLLPHRNQNLLRGAAGK